MLHINKIKSQDISPWDITCGFIFFRVQGSANATNVDIIADLYAEVIGVLVQARN